jgi:hypothetical protein
MNRWLTERRDFASDYEHAFGRPAPRVKGLRLQINSQHTGGRAESCSSVRPTNSWTAPKLPPRRRRPLPLDEDPKAEATAN